MPVSRRDIIKAAGALGALTVFAAGYAPMLQGIAKGWWAGEVPRDPLSGNAPEPEFRVDPATGQVTPNPNQYVANSVCVGCTSICGVRVRVDRNTGQVLRVTGNPYHVLSSDPYLAYETPIEASFQSVSRFQERGLTYRATACGRGNAVLSKLYDPYRVLTPLKRVGKRGAGKWQPISFEQLVQEVVEGGDLFGEGQVDGLRAIRDLKTPLDPNAPEFGPKANQMLFLFGFEEGRVNFAKRFVGAFGSVNMAEHRGNCGFSMRAGYAALLGDWAAQPHLKPDFRNARFILNIGTAPGNAGNPFKRQAKLIAEGRSEGSLNYVVVDPVLTNSDQLSAGPRSRWIPINPGTDGALAMGMIRWILENKRYNEKFLSQPNANAAKAAGEPSWSNATHLVIVDPASADVGKFVRGSQLGLAPEGDSDTFVVMDATGKPLANTQPTGPAQLFFSGTLDVKGTSVAVKTGLQVLCDEVSKYTLDEYAQACGIPAATITELADRFTSYGRQAVADCHGGTMASNGFYTAYAIVLLNALVGNLNWKGGSSAGGGKYQDYAAGPRYDLTKLPTPVATQDAVISRQGFAYEKTSEFARKKAAGEKTYPAPAPWYPFSTGLQSEFILSGLNGYPYSAKAMILWNTNPLYGAAGLYESAKDALADSKKIPLTISIDPFINETSAFADYVVPDTVLYETWGVTFPWGGSLNKVNSVRWPVVEPPQSKTAEGDPVGMESFLIAVAKRIGLPGFGDGAIADMNGNWLPLNHPQDYHLRAVANVAFDVKPVPDASDSDADLTGVKRVWDKLQATLKAEEVQKVAFVLARGGRFEDAAKSYEGDWLGVRYGKPMQVYDERVGTVKNSMNGKRFIGTATWVPPVFTDETPVDSVYKPSEYPFRLVSTKSQLLSASVMGVTRLQDIHPSNLVLIHSDDAERLGIHYGDQVRLTSPGGKAEGIALVSRGIQRGTIGIEHGYGHWALGASDTSIGNTVWHASAQRAAGISSNRLGISDPKRQELSTLGDFVVGSNARQALPVRVEKT